MKLLKLERLAEDQKTVSLILNEVKEDFDIVDNYAIKAKANLSQNPEAIKSWLSKLGGAFSSLKIAWAVVETAKTNTELRHYYGKKFNYTKNNPGKKFTATAEKEEARAKVLEYRRVRNYIGAYVETTEKNITILQSLKKNTQIEHTTPGE